MKVGSNWRRVRAVPFLMALAIALYLTGAAPGDAARLYVVDADRGNAPSELSFVPRCNAVLSGSILVGDYDKVGAALKRAEFKREFSGYKALCLASDGGDLREAIKLGTLFKDWMMVVEEGSRCISACAVLFMSGHTRDTVDGVDTSWPGRHLHHRATLAFHAPALETASRDVDPESYRQAYARALGTIAMLGFYDHFAIEAHLDQFHRASPLWGNEQFSAAQERADEIGGILPLGLLGAILSTPPDQLYPIDRIGQALAWGIDIYGFAAPRVLSRHMLYVGCVNVARARCQFTAGQGFSSQRCLSYLRVRHIRSPIDTKLRQHDAASLDQFLHRVGDKLKPRKQAPWPRGSQARDGAASQAVALGDVCEIRATWRDGAIANLEIDTFNSATRDGRPLLEEKVEDAIGRNRRLGVKRALDHQLRTWKLLPASTRLAEIDAGTWALLEAGGDFFDRRASFQRGSR